MKANRRTLLLLSLGVTTLGCNMTINDVKTNKKFYDDWPLVGRDKNEPPPPYPRPAKMAATWSPDTLVQSGHTPTRGFGGRIYFYDEKSKAVPVDGTLVVHGFDDTMAADGEPSPAKRFEFTPDQFTSHFSHSDLGASYSVWVPWDPVGGPQRRVSLVASFQTVGGKIVQGEPATILLPGYVESDPVAEEHTMFSAQYHRHRKALASADSAQGMTTTTIARRGGAAGKPNQTPDSNIVRSRTGELNVLPASSRTQR